MASQQVQSEQKKALIIGISDYTDPDLPQLDFCKDDGRDILKVLDSIGYNIFDKNKSIGRTKMENLRKAINSFFKTAKTNEILLFYYSGHGVLDDEGDMYLASTETDADNPDSETCFPLNELTKLVRKSISKVVVILDCCYSGSIQVAKGDEEAAAKKGRKAIVENSNLISQGQGKYILAASQAAQEALGPRTGKNSIFTSILLEGLKGKAVDPEGHVTPQSLGKYVYEEMIKPDGERPKQIPFLKTDDSGDVILAHYNNLKSLKKIKDTDTIEPLNHGSDRKSPTKNGLFRSFFLRKRGEKYRLTIPILVAVVVSISIIISVLVLYPGPLPAKHYFLKRFWIYSSSNQSYNPKQSVNFPDSIAVDSTGGHVYVAENGNDQIQNLDGNGYYISEWGTFGSLNGQFNSPYGIVVDSTGGHIYVSDSGNNRIQEFDSNGHFITKWGTKGSANGQFEEPGSIAVDNWGNVYVADAQVDNVQKFDSNGHFITKWSPNDSSYEQIYSISSIGVDSSGNVYVADVGKSHNFIHVYSPTG